MRRIPARVRRCWRRWRRDTHATATVLMALFSLVLLGSAAIGIDGAHFFLAKRRQQSATDMAAMAAAASLDTAAAKAATVMAANGFATGISLAVNPGVYLADPTLAASARFRTAGTPNAVKVVSTSTVPFIFGAAFRALLGVTEPGDGFPIQTTAVAQKQDTAAFTLGSGLASLDNGVLNAVLGSLLGTRLSLTLLDYQSLASASVDLFSFSDALATQVHASAPSYGALALTSVTRSALLGSLAATLTGPAAAGAAVRSIAGSVPAGGAVLGTLIDFGQSGTLQIGAQHPMSARVSALDLLRGVALLGGNHLVSLDFGTSLAGLGSTQLMMSVGTPASGSGFFAVGAEGATLHSAQIRLLLSTQVGGTGLPASLALPLYLEVAPATATIAAIACTTGAAGAGVTLNVVTGVADAVIGSLSGSDFSNMSSSPAIGPATLLNLAGVLRLSAQAHATATPSGTLPVSFTAADIRAATAKTVSSGVSLASLTASLVNGTAVTVTTLGASLPQPSLPQAVTAALRTALTPIDALLGQVLATLGLSVGTATTTVPGVRCGQGVLVN